MLLDPLDTRCSVETGAEFGTRAEVASTTLVLFGRALDFEKREAEVANVLVHRADDTLYVVDTGATAHFRARLLETIESMRPFRHVVLVTSHGHPDHVANNSLIDEIPAESCRHYASLHDFALLADSAGYLRRAFEEVTPYLDTPTTAAMMTDDLLAMIGPIESRADRVIPIDSLPAHALEIGGTPWEGWRLGTDLQVLRLHGHTAGHIGIYVPSLRLLFLGDETNTCYAPWSDSTPWASFGGLRKGLRMCKAGVVAHMLDGHHATVFDPDGARRLLGQLINDYQFFDHVVIDTLKKREGGTTLGDIADTVAASGLGVRDGTHSLFSTMRILRKVRDVGAVALSGEGPETRFGYRVR